jgi:hypothetical protein
MLGTAIAAGAGALLGQVIGGAIKTGAIKAPPEAGDKATSVFDALTTFAIAPPAKDPDK